MLTTRKSPHLLCAMPKACEGDEHVFYNIETVFPSGFVFKVDEDGMFRCYCGKITLTQPSSPSPMCDACHHPQTHHLFGYCYGPVEYDADGCRCSQFVPKPPPVLGPRKITL